MQAPVFHPRIFGKEKKYIGEKRREKRKLGMVAGAVHRMPALRAIGRQVFRAP